MSDKYQKAVVLPQPPRPDEYYNYFGKQYLRLLSVLLFILSAGSVYGVWAVFSLSWVWYPFLIMLVVLIPWTLYVIVLATYRPRVTPESHALVKQAGNGMLYHDVDILIPVCGEDIAVIRNTFYHVSQMYWPGRMQVYCLDDGDSTEVMQLAEEFGFSYTVRTNRPDFKKSGNLNNGMEVSSSEFIAVFDADFAPSRNFLTETMPYMMYENVGIVQTSQYFDVRMSETRNWVQQLSGSVQDMFFCWAQPARNSADSAMCVGTNVVYRRSAIEAIGGFPRVEEGGEDIVTGLMMYQQQIRTIYIPINVAKGACPDSFAAAVNQQYRWALSTMKMFIPGNNLYSKAFRQAPLTIRQRVVFWSGAAYYIQSILVFITAFVPSLVMLWFFPQFVGIGNYIPIAPAMLGMFALPLIIRGWRPATLRIILVYSASHLLAAIDTIKGKRAEWTPTGGSTGMSDVAEKAGQIVRWCVVLTQGLSWIAIFMAVPIYSVATFWPAIVLTLFQTVVLFPLLLPKYGTVAQLTLLPHFTRKHIHDRRVRKWQLDELSQRQ